MNTLHDTDSLEVMREFLARLAMIQAGTAPIELSIGAVINNLVFHTVVVIKNAPPKALSDIILWVRDEELVSVSVANGGLTINFR